MCCRIRKINTLFARITGAERCDRHTWLWRRWQTRWIRNNRNDRLNVASLSGRDNVCAQRRGATTGSTVPQRLTYLFYATNARHLSRDRIDRGALGWFCPRAGERRDRRCIDGLTADGGIRIRKCQRTGNRAIKNERTLIRCCL